MGRRKGRLVYGLPHLAADGMVREGEEWCGVEALTREDMERVWQKV